MRARYIWTASVLTLKEVLRRRIVLLLLLLIPSIFYAITYLTTDTTPFPFLLAAVKGEPGLMVPARHIALVFMGLASTGILAAFLSMSLIQRNLSATRRLIICGYTTPEISIPRLLVLFVIMVLLGFYVGSMICLFFNILYLESYLSNRIIISSV